MMARLLLALVLASPVFAQQVVPPSSDVHKPPHSPEINTTLMETTFLVSGPSARAGEQDKDRFGVGFVLLRHVKQDSDETRYVLVTAKHVFEDIRGDTAILLLRKRNLVGDPVPFPFPISIRDKGKNLYTGNLDADVAVIDVALPKDSIVVQLGPEITNINWLATDEFLKDIKIHPGDELSCLGFPLGLAGSDADYPVLRSGKIASYPIIPLKKARRIAYDFHVEAGNSGGPVYFSFNYRPYKDVLSFGLTYQKIFGLVTEKVNPVGDVDPSIGIIVPSIYIKETIDLLAGFESKIKEDQ
jgi:hypothetical protein